MLDVLHCMAVQICISFAGFPSLHFIAFDYFSIPMFHAHSILDSVNPTYEWNLKQHNSSLPLKETLEI